MPSSILNNIRIVLVKPQQAGNIGSVARGMKNMGLSRLCLVAPPPDWFQQAKIMAANSLNVLRRADVVSNISDAVRESIFIVGTTRRGGEARSPLDLNRDTATLLLRKAREGIVSVLFGNERVGLSDDDLSLCHLSLRIVTTPRQPSLNLSHAVLILGYELFCASSEPAVRIVRKDKTKYLAKESDLDEMCGLVEPALIKLGYWNGKKRRNLDILLKTIKRTAKKCEFELRDVRMIEGIARRIRDFDLEKTGLNP